MPNRSIVMMSGLATRKAFDDHLFAAFTAQTGVEVVPIYDPTVQLLRRLDAGEHFDVMIAATPSLDALIANGIVAEGPRPIVRSGIGLAVARGAEHTKVTTRDDLVATLTTARSVAYSRTGQSGIYFVDLVKRLGLEDVVLPKATVLEKGFTATALESGEADLAVQQLSELLFVPGAEIVGPLPEELQKWTEFSAGTAVASTENADVAAFVDFISSPEAAHAYRATALEPVPSGLLS
ncbi:molybdate transport system substrate-binding protein [Streptomyces sp. SAI-135]|uniref:substrate-binding domain-containing protein n=1 Tax=unclassified Streptomyces TaxID=2593676 RepID=UPI002474BA42|nr:MULTISPECIES: substrate-binding domain-containing protein [unclassified Streptomyces]MDH6522814.1 molybdate transport system substrate-binding protein [Streptomyces sp. SAI-090]MDH6554435.1 molybdate transport system substrate-binding protein [Streptomyces sp. SAI-041]MDH6573701.1 molybdate transport system substrate-binding protein [Streptomyces sp. SAI-117]MDH6613571.1 molybdate transport system substrate-binding protein [Streptomyces sp. SAI-135]